MVSVLSTKEIRRTMIFQCYLFIWEIPISLASSWYNVVLLEGKKTFKAYYNFKFKGLITVSPVSKMHIIKVVYNHQINVLT